MNVAFIVNIDLDDLSTLADTATDIQDALEEKGYEIKSVAPWARPALTQSGTAPLIPTNVPINQNKPTNQEPIL